MAIETLGRTIDVIPTAAGAGFSLKNASGCLFVCTGADTYTLTCADTFAGSYATPGNIIVRKYTASANNGTVAWVKVAQTAANTVVNAGATTTAFWVDAASLPDTKRYLKLSVGASGLVVAILGDLRIQRSPENLAIKGA